ncbi:hypothetical protein ACJQWY_01280 [Weissella kandleri]|uniref:hypothetical protein n=1 Tax=Weissella kandleri TaxID=1616 RepID=UPI00387E8587
MATNQTKANKKWQEQNKEYTKYLNYRSRARSFIRNMATIDDIDELLELIDGRKESLKTGE